MPRNSGPCKTQACGGTRRRIDTDYCPACNKRRRNAKHYLSSTRRRVRERNRKRTIRAIERARAREEAALDAMVAAPLPHTRGPAYLEVPRAVASLERSEVDMNFWYVWYNNPDNPCTKEALDAKGW